MSRVPTFNRKVRVIVDWTLALFFRREIVSLGGMHEPFKEFQEAAGSTRAAHGPEAASARTAVSLARVMT